MVVNFHFAAGNLIFLSNFFGVAELGGDLSLVSGTPILHNISNSIKYSSFFVDNKNHTIPQASAALPEELVQHVSAI